MIEYSFCEGVWASSQSFWHIRKLTDKGKFLGGGIDTTSLCNFVKEGWDLDVEITDYHLETNTCSECAKAYLLLIGSES